MVNSGKKDIATSFSTFLFFVVGISGILMFFHVFDDYTKILHEILGLAFVLSSAFHILVNWKQMKRYFSKKAFIISGILVFLISLILIFQSKDNKDTKDVIIDSLLNSPISYSFVVLNNEGFEQTKVKVEENGIVIDGSATIEEICKNNGVSPQKVLEIIMHQ